MSGDDKQTPQPSNVPSQDMYVVQALTAAKAMAQDHRGEGPGWNELEVRLDRVLDALSSAGGEPQDTQPAGTPRTADMPRIDRQALQADPHLADRVVSTLAALEDQSDPHRLQLATDALAEFEGAVR